MINRRGFLSLFAPAIVTAAGYRTGLWKPPTLYFTPYAGDGIPLTTIAHPTLATNMPRALWPGIKDWWSKRYGDDLSEAALEKMLVDVQRFHPGGIKITRVD